MSSGKTREAVKRFFSAISCVIVYLITVGCGAQTLYLVKQPQSTAIAPQGAFRAGAARVDITPPLGYPLFGYSLDGAESASGYRTRLHARAIVLEDAIGSRVALVQVELGAVSALLHRKTAHQLAPIGIGPAQLLIAASHTHAGPGGYFGSVFYNTFGAGRMGFDPELLDWLSSRITRAVKQAAASLVPAAVAAGQIEIPNVNRQRSREAWEANFKCPFLRPEHDTNRTLTMLRIDRIIEAVAETTISEDTSEAENGTVVSESSTEPPPDKAAKLSTAPLAAFFVFPIHGTSISHHNKLYHGDVHAATAQLFESLISPQEDSFVGAFANGTQGDVSPAWKTQNHKETARLGSMIASAAASLYRSLEPDQQPGNIRIGYREVALPGALTQGGRLCEEAVVGVPTLGGAEDGRSMLHGKLGVEEGVFRSPEGGDCQSYKIEALGELQDIILDTEHFPTMASFQVVQIGDVMTLATIPGEPTTEAGNQIVEALKQPKRPIRGRSQKAKAEYIAVVGLVNEYIGYVTTAEEFGGQRYIPGREDCHESDYNKRGKDCGGQHYEGSSTLYGPLTALLAQEQLELAAVSARHAQPVFLPIRRFYPGQKVSFLGNRGECHAEKWKAGKIEAQRDGDKIRKTVFSWRGYSSKQNCGPLPRIRLECSGAKVVDTLGVIVDDDNIYSTVQRKGDDKWTIEWTPPAPVQAPKPCRFMVDRPALEPIRSKEF